MPYPRTSRKSRPTPATRRLLTRCTAARTSRSFEILETRTLFSVNLGGITLNLPSNLQSLLSDIPGLSKPTLDQEWWLQNTGQTLSDPVLGPATGTPGADVNALNAWNITQGKSNVVIAVFDTGIDLSNPDLASVLWTNPGNLTGDTYTNDLHGWNFVDNNNDVSDNFVHGTAVADAIHSVAPGVTILPIEVGTSSGAPDQNIINAINYVIMLKKAGVDIVAINASYISTSIPSMSVLNAISSAGKAGMLYCAAAGNLGMNLDSLIPSIGGFNISSFLPSNLIFVAATDNQDNLASFSDYGSSLVSLGAPGVDMDLAIPGGIYAPLSGTSFAAPMVSAIAGLLASEVPTASMSQLKTAILNSGDLDPALSGKTSTGRRADAYNALQYLMGQQKPTGALDPITSTTITGWAYDANLGAAADTVQISIDGVLYTGITADISRPDLQSKLPSTDHGFSFDASTLDLAYGKHTVKVFAVDNTTSLTTLIGQGTLIITSAPIGALESTDNMLVTGWADDTDTPTKADSVKLYFDGKLWKTVTASVNRPDLVDTLGSANHGFSVSLKGMPAGIHRLDVYAVDSLTGGLTLLGSDVLSSNRPVTGAVESLTATNITGWAFDPDAGSSSVQVSYQIDGGPPVLITANISRTDLQTALGSKNHGFSITLPQLTAGDHTITVNAIDPNNALVVQLASQTITVTDPSGNPLPTGTITTMSTALVAGTVTDTNSTAPLKVRIDIDGKAGKVFTSTATDDPATDNFSFTMPKLSAGPHRVDVYAIDQTSGALVLLDRALVGYTAPTGLLESITTQSAVGWALNPNLKNSQVQIRIDIDGLTGNLITANLKRTDLIPTLGSPNFGFNVALPQALPGTHHITITLLDPTTLTPIILYDADLVFS